MIISDIEEIEILPSKYLKHLDQINASPNTVKSAAFALSYYYNYLQEQTIGLDEITLLSYSEQNKHFIDFLYWVKSGKHTEHKTQTSNKTCNMYLGAVFRYYQFLALEDVLPMLKVLRVKKVSYFDSMGVNHQNAVNSFKGFFKEEESNLEEITSEEIQELSDMRIIVHNSVGVKRTLYRNTFHGYLQEKGHIGKTIEQDKIVILLKACANCRDQILLLLLAETGFRIGELLGVRYATDIDYERHLLYVNFREDNENGARAKNAEYRKAKISDATFEILQFYIEEYKDLIFQQEYLIINISGDYAGKPMQDSGVYALMERLQKKTGIKVTPHMLRHYFANARRKAGWKLELISQALGHRNIETTMRYLNISDQELIDVSDEFYRKHQSIYEIDKLL